MRSTLRSIYEKALPVLLSKKIQDLMEKNGNGNMAWNQTYRTKLASWRSKIYQTNEKGTMKRQRQHAAGKLTAREQIETLFDERTFHETDQYAQSQSTDFGMAEKRCPGDGVITGWGRIHGQVVYAAVQDITVMGGSLGKIHGEKIWRIQDQAYENRCPIIFLIDSGGARVEEGVAALSGYSGIFRRNVKCSGFIPQIALLLGCSVGGSSYLPAMCDFTFMTQQTARMFITGPGVVKEATGEEISAEELGGARMHSELSGAADFVFRDDAEVIREARKFFTYICPGCAIHEDSNMTETDKSAYLEEIVPDDQRKTYDMRQVIGILTDQHSFYECKERYAKNLIVGFGRMNGDTIGIVANQPMELCGSLDAKASEKAARFIRFCDCFDIPILTLVDTPGFFPGKQQEEEGIIRRGAKLLYAYAEATVPKITLVLRKAYGGAYIAMNSKCIGADLVYAWPIAQLAVLGAEGAVNVVFRKEIARSEDPEADRKRKTEEYRRKFMNPYFAASQGYIDEIICPEETKRTLWHAFEGRRDRRKESAEKKHGNISL